MKAFFDLKDFDPKGGGGGAVYLFDDGPKNKKSPGRAVIPFRIAEEGRLELQAPLPPDTRDIWLGLPVSMFGFRLLEFPFADMEKIRQTLPFELEGLILQGPEEVILEALPLGEGEAQKQKVLAVYAGKRQLANLIESMKGAGAEPAVITSIEIARAMAKGASDIADTLFEAPPSDERARMDLAEAEFPGGKPTLNFRRGELEFTRGKEETSRQLRTAFVLAALLLFVFAVKSAVGLYFIHRQAAGIEERIERSFSQILPGRKMQNSQVALMELEAGLAQLKREGSKVGGLPALEALKTLSAHGDRAAVISEISMDSGGTIIKGRAGTLADVNAEKNALEQSGAGVKVLETGNGPKGVLFTMSVRFAGQTSGLPGDHSPKDNSPGMTGGGK
ncbi:MAG: hypothetical protein M0Z58_05920 [Nitrospiraceae bacterium]|nr:hypothetical protein [Nitrospiraceae bacterium]